MLLSKGHHLAYCTKYPPRRNVAGNVGRVGAIHACRASERVCPGEPYAIGLRLSDTASRQLSEPPCCWHFQRWLERNDCYVFTINGFPFGQFHGQRVKEQVYRAGLDNSANGSNTPTGCSICWRNCFRPASKEASAPCPARSRNSSRRLIRSGKIRANIFRCVEHIAELSEQTGTRAASRRGAGTALPFGNDGGNGGISSSGCVLSIGNDPRIGAVSGRQLRHLPSGG